MSRECATCGFDNPNEAPVCELCGAPLPVEAAFAHPHRVPSGLVRMPTGAHDTDLGYPDVADTLQTADPDEGWPAPITDIGEQAAQVAAASSGSFAAVPSDRRPRPAPISEVGEAAGVAVVGGDKRGPAQPVRLLGRLKLVVEQGLIIGEQYLLAEPEMLIGRADQTAQNYPDIDLGGQDNDYVHRLHARLQFHDLNTRLSVEHLGGANPTLVNNQPVSAGELVELFPGDRLRVGRVVMRLAPV